ncbi:type II toxin-antitoxin system VapC family toxin [Actinomycetospora sp. CA-101289]|uniref:type II toxin-antitoxin system VapC family toxin n=1 Tax=Actinomycetospora sp. CA-101289 TaxID=3239893 RepID=UPI003D977BE0
MIVDSSALVAIIRQETDAHRYDEAIIAATSARLSAATYLEASIVVDGARDPVLSRQLDRYLEIMRIAVEPLTERQARIARQAYRDFGRGSGHQAKLNYGDCFAYALATDTGEPLLFKGDDFVHTDVTPAAPR